MTNWLKYLFRKTKLIVRLLFVLAITLSAKQAGSEGNEYNVKAMFVLNFIKYVEWPSDNNSNYIRIGVIGKTEMLDALRAMTANRNETKQIKIEEVGDQSKDGYKIIFIGKSENNHMEDLLKKYKNKGVLLISEECKGKNAAAINLLNINNKIRFEINMSQAHEQGIRISSRLNELAISVKQ